MRRVYSFLISLFLVCSIWFAYPAFAATSTCIDFAEGRLCLSFEKNGDYYDLSRSVSNYDGDGYPVIFCQVKEPGSAGATLYHVAGCDDGFTYDGTTNGYFTVYIWFDNESQTMQYDINDAKRSVVEADYTDDDDDNDDGDIGTVTKYNVTTDDTTPDVDQKIDLYVKPQDSDGTTDDTYNEQARIEVAKQETDGDYDTITTSYYRVSDSTPQIDLDGATKESLNDYISFEDEGKYRVKVYEDADEDIYGYVYITIGDTNSNDDEDVGTVTKYNVTTDDTTPDTDQKIDLYVKPQDSDDTTDTTYNEQATIEIAKRDSGGSYKIVTTSYYRVSDSTPQIDLDGSSKESLNDYVSFEDEGKYRIKVYEDGDEDIYGYVYITIGDTNNNDDEDVGTVTKYNVTTDDTTPDTNQQIDLYIKPQDKNSTTDTSYNEQGRIEVAKKTSNGTYDTLSTSYYRVSDSTPQIDLDGASKETFSNYISFENVGTYRIKVYEDADEDVYGYVYVTVSDDDTSMSSVDGFTTKQLAKIQKYYKVRPTLIAKLRAKYPDVRRSATRDNMQEELYQNMKDLVYDEEDREFDTYAEFRTDFIAFIRYTIRIK